MGPSILKDKPPQKSQNHTSYDPRNIDEGSPEIPKGNVPGQNIRPYKCQQIGDHHHEKGKFQGKPHGTPIGTVLNGTDIIV